MTLQVSNQKIYQMSQFTKPMRDKCTACERNIIKDSTKINGNSYHDDCVRCKNCNIHLKTNYFVSEDSLYCQKHYKELSAPKPVVLNVQKKEYPISYNQIDLDSLSIVCSFMTVFEVGTISRVSSGWYQGIIQNHPYWRTQSLLMWPADRHLKVQPLNWHVHYITRANLVKVDKKKVLQNCNMDPMKFLCPISWDSLSATGHHKVRTCNACQEKVYHCIDLEELDVLAKDGKCVMFFPFQLSGMEFEWKTRDDWESIGPQVVGRRCF